VIVVPRRGLVSILTIRIERIETMMLAPTKVRSLRFDTPELDNSTLMPFGGVSRAALMTAILVRLLQQNLISALDRPASICP
jgi:hypothetical protein